MDVGGGELDQALEERALGRVVGAHPGRLEILVRLEEVAAVVGGQTRPPGPRLVPRAGSGRYALARPSRPTTTERSVIASSAQRAAAGEPGVEPCHQPIVGLAALPAQPDLPAGDEGREVDQAVLDVAEGEAQRVDPRDAGRHLVDQALHPQPGQPQVVDRRRVGRELRPVRSLGDRRGGTVARPAPGGQDLVAQPDELGALLGEQAQDPVELGDGGVGGVDVVEAGHRWRF